MLCCYFSYFIDLVEALHNGCSEYVQLDVRKQVLLNVQLIYDL